MSAPAQAPLASLSTLKKAGPIAEPPAELPTAAISGASDQADFDDTASIAEPPQDESPSANIEPAQPAPENDAELATRDTPLNSERADAHPEKAAPDPGPGNDTSLSARDTDEEGSPQVEIAEPPQPASPIVGNASVAASSEQLTPEAAAPAATFHAAEAKIVEPSPPASPVANIASVVAGIEQAATKAAMKPPAPKLAEAKITKPSQPAGPVTSSIGKAARVEPAAAQGETPSGAPKAGKDTPRPKQAARSTPPQEDVSQPRGTSPWKPMALAPNDKPSAPSPRLSGNYSAKVWSALARNKPKAGQRGSTTVIFAIGDSGGLRFVRVGRSSGNPRLDQLALATVRNAAPYPAPPGGAQSFTIRIDFH